SGYPSDATENSVQANIITVYGNSVASPTATPIPTATPVTGPIALYTFDGNGNDTSGYGKNATVTGGTYVTGKKGQAVNLNGTSSQYVTLPSGVVANLGNYTVTAWVKLTAVSTWARLFDFGNDTNTYMFFAPSSGSNARFAITNSGNGSEQQLNRSSVLTTGAWIHIAITRNGNTGTLYVNGASVATNTSMTLSPASLGATVNNWIGRSQFSGDPYLNGAIDEFRIYNRALSAAEISTLYTNP
ncbi:MAG: LamG-like jellyroll fold domain-containing protein, partial [Anaerolineales bacterium]